eukprot:12400135-Karenia_brevis.AAC.1
MQKTPLRSSAVRVGASATEATTPFCHSFGRSWALCRAANSPPLQLPRSRPRQPGNTQTHETSHLTHCDKTM